MSIFRTAATMAALFTAVPAATAADVEFWYPDFGRLGEAIRSHCEAFNAARSIHNISCVDQVNYETSMQKAIAAYRSDRHPAMILFFDAGTLDLMLSDAVIPVQDVLPEAPWEDYLNGARSYYETSRGELFSQPYNGSTLVFYANMELLGKAGMTDLPDTYEKLHDAAQRLKAAGLDCAYTTDGHPWRVLEQFSARHGEAIASNNNGYGGLDAEYTFNEGLVARHLANLAAWREEGLVKLNQDTVAGKYTTAFNTGECAMMEASTGSYAAAFTALGENLKMGLAPIYEGYERRNTLIGGGSIWLMKGHSDEVYEAAAAFMDFVRGNEQQLAFARHTGYMPVTNAAFASLVGGDQANDPAFATARLGVSSLNQPGDDNSRGIRLGFYMQFRDIFREETQQAFNGDKTMQAALDDAVSRGNALLRRFEQTYQGAELP